MPRGLKKGTPNPRYMGERIKFTLRLKPALLEHFMTISNKTKIPINTLITDLMEEERCITHGKSDLAD